MSGPYAIGADTWPGISKLIEEAGEVTQVCGKLLGTGAFGTYFRRVSAACPPSTRIIRCVERRTPGAVLKVRAEFGAAASGLNG